MQDQDNDGKIHNNFERAVTHLMSNDPVAKRQAATKSRELYKFPVLRMCLMVLNQVFVSLVFIFKVILQKSIRNYWMHGEWHKKKANSINSTKKNMDSKCPKKPNRLNKEQVAAMVATQVPSALQKPKSNSSAEGVAVAMSISSVVAATLSNPTLQGSTYARVTSCDSDCVVLSLENVGKTALIPCALPGGLKDRRYELKDYEGHLLLPTCEGGVMQIQ